MDVCKVLALCAVIVNVRSRNLGRNNVCTNFQAYGNIQNNKHCYYNPDLDSTPSDIANRYGYKLDKYTATTEDGYIIGIFRLRKPSSTEKFGQPVILMHGIIVDGLSWMISGNKSMAFNLVASGFDLWIPNFRGTAFSGQHVNSTISEKDYWNFSFEEIGVYDLPAVIEQVAKTTSRNDIIYIGHSMGASTALVYSSMKQEHARLYIKGFIYLAPVAYIQNVKGAMRMVIPFIPLIRNILSTLEVHAIGTSPELQQFITGLACGSFPLILACQIIYSFATGLVVEQIRPEILPVVLKYYPSGTSVKLLLHFSQIILSQGRFQRFDYGKETNLKIYNSSIPPIYDIEKIQIPTHLFAGNNDFLSELEDVKNLYNHLHSPKSLHRYDVSHNDYLYGKEVNKLYQDVINVIDSLSDDKIK